MTSSDLPSNDWSLPMTPSIGGAACCASAAPMVSVHARRVKPRRCITPRRADLGSWGAESVRNVCEIFIRFSWMIIVFSLIVVSFSLRLASDECEDVRIDHVGMGGHHAVGEARVNLQRAMLQQLSLQQRSVFVGNNLV